MAKVQLIHNIVGVTVDVYVDHALVADNFAFQTATPLSTQIAAGQHAVHVVPANAPDNSSALATIPVVLAADGIYTVIANGDVLNFDFKMLSNTRSESVADGKVEFRVVIDGASLGEVDLRSLTETGRWANNLSFNEATGYRTTEAIVHNVEFLDGHTQIQFDLPSTADVEIQVIDLLGRMVLSLPSQSVEAGANRTVELDGSSLASGTYLYRRIAKMESIVQVETGLMVLIK